MAVRVALADDECQLQSQLEAAKLEVDKIQQRAEKHETQFKRQYEAKVPTYVHLSIKCQQVGIKEKKTGIYKH